MPHTIDISRKIMNASRRDDGCDSGKGLALLLHEDNIQTTIETVHSDSLPGITLDVFAETAHLKYLHEDNIQTTIETVHSDSLPGITLDVFAETVLHFIPTASSTIYSNYNILVKQVDLATLFNIIQIVYYYKDTSNSKCLMDLTCQTLVNKVTNKTFGKSDGFILTKNVIVVLLQSLYAKCTQRHADNLLRQRGKGIFTKNAMFEDLRLSPFVSNRLSFVDRREKQCSDYLHELMECADFERLLEIINSLSILVSADQKSADLVDSDTAKYVLEIARYYEGDDIQCQAVYILSCVSIAKCYDVMTNDVIPVLVKLLSDSFYRLAIAAVIALTRLANTSPGCIKVILDMGGLEAALKTAKECRNRQKIIYCLAKFLAVVCRSYDLPPDKVEVAVTILEELFQNKLTSDYHIVHACHTLQYLTYGRDVEIGEKLLHKLVALIYKFLSIEDILIASSALGVVGNIARWGNPNTIQVLTSSCVLLSCLRNIIVWCEFKKIWKEACRIISNIAVRGTFTKDMDAEVDLIASLCSLLKKDDYEVRMEAVWAICNCIYGKRERRILNL